MKKAFIAALFLFPSITFASSLSQPQVSAIVALLQAFNVDQQVITLVQGELGSFSPITSDSAPVQNTGMTDVQIASSNDCIPNPVLNVTANRTSAGAGIELFVQYANNCDDTPTLLTSNIPWSYVIKDAATGLITANPRLLPIASGILLPNNPNPIAYWTAGTDNNSVIYRGTDSGTYNALNITVTVGATTQTIVIPSGIQARSECADVSNQVAQLRDDAAKTESAYATGGLTTAVAQGHAQDVAQKELQQEAPLLAQAKEAGCN